MKRSRKINLMVLGTAVLMTGCSGSSSSSTSSSDSEIQYKQYASQADCERDWGKATDNQQPCTRSGSGGYWGPRYYWNHSTGRPVAIMSDGSHRPMSAEALSRSSLANAHSSSSASSRSSGISRGGFGGFGRGSAGG